LWPSVMNSSAAPNAAIHGVEARIASRNTRPKPSSRLGITKSVASSVQRCQRRFIDTSQERDPVASLGSLLSQPRRVVASPTTIRCASAIVRLTAGTFLSERHALVPLARVHSADDERISSFEWSGGQPRPRRHSGVADGNRFFAHPWVRYAESHGVCADIAITFHALPIAAFCRALRGVQASIPIRNRDEPGTSPD
jgi:hypothetical protein